MHLNRFHLAGSIVVIAALAVAFAMIRQSQTIEPAVTLTIPSQKSLPLGPPSTNGAPASAREEKTVTAAQRPPAGGPAVSARLPAELSSARDWPAFALAARQRPEEGGYYYAQYIAGLCSRNMPALNAVAHAAVADAVQKTGTVDANRLKVVEEFASRCASFTPGEASQVSRDARAMQVDGRDPLLWSQHELLRGVMSRDPEARKASGMFFDGKVYSAEQGAVYDELRWAVKLGSCVDKLPCSLDDLMVLTCITGGYCADDRCGYVRNATWVSRTAAKNLKIALESRFPKEAR